MIGSKKFQLNDETVKYYNHVLDAVDKSKYPHIVNPCLTGDTWILTSNGWKQIVDLVNVGFEAVVYGQKNQSNGFWSNGFKKVYEITTVKNKKIKATLNHRFKRFIDRESWTELKDFVVGDSICMDDGRAEEIVSIVEIEEEQEVFDCTVENVHCFIANGFVSHNCGEISLHKKGGYCVGENTRILHKNGYDKIKDLVDKEIDVFNGENWSTTTVVKTGENQKLMRLTFSDGSILDCTEYHKFIARKRRQAPNFLEFEAKDLKVGYYLPKFIVDKKSDGLSVKDAYTYGVFLGDGSYYKRSDVNSYRYEICLYGEQKWELPVTGSRSSAPDANNGISVNVSHLDHDKLKSLKDNDDLPDWVYQLDHDSMINFIRGWIDTDGCSCGDVIGGFNITNNSELRIRGLQLLLRKVGIGYSSVKISASKGQKTNFGIRQNDLWLCYIPKFEAAKVSGFRVKAICDADSSKPTRQQKIEKIEYLDGLHDTYCFHEKEKNMGVFNNVLTKQCVIADLIPFFRDNRSDIINDAKLAARFLIRANLMDSIYSDEVKRTNRIGVAMTGIHEFAWKHFFYGFNDLIDENISQDFWTFIERIRVEIEDAADEYSDLIGVNHPHTYTTIKPSGSVSKLYNVTEGAHLPARKFYLRWVQIQNSDPILQKYINEGYPIKVLKKYPNVTAVGFPTAPLITQLGMGDKLVTAFDASPEDQFKWLMLLEKYWLGGDGANGQISYTMKIDTSKYSLKEIKDLILEYQPKVKCCSILPSISDEKIKELYEYMPEENIDEAQYLDIKARVESASTTQEFSQEELICSSGACPL